MYLSQGEVNGHIVELARSNPRHLVGTAVEPAGRQAPTKSFAELLAGTFEGVNNLQTSSMELGQRMITDPDSVDIHDVSIAMAEANLSLSMTKAVVDRAIRAYREIVSIR